MSTFKQRQVRVFISSPMSEERDILIKHVFPEIRRRCQARGVDFVNVDLRLQQQARGESVAMSFQRFQQIDLCRPYFIGLLGEYYGSAVLPVLPEQMVPDYPWIKNDCSITELEILYAVFDVGQNVSQDELQASAKNALFYFRDDTLIEHEDENLDSQSFYLKRQSGQSVLSCFSNPHDVDTLPDSQAQSNIKTLDSPKKLQDLKQRIRAHSCHITEYKQAADLKNLVLEQLWTKIVQDFPDTFSEQAREEREDFEHDAFACSRQAFYVKEQAHFDRLTAHALSNVPPLVIVGESGCGKSALLANWALAYRQAHPDDLVFWHFCGHSPCTSSSSTEHVALLLRVMRAFKSHFMMDDELPNTAVAVIEQFPLWLAKVHAQGRVILIIDGLNKLEDSLINQGWLPDFFPAHIRLFLSTLPDMSPLELGLKGVSWELPLLSETARDAFITGYLQQYDKILRFPPSPERRGLLDAPQSGNPLYLKLILDGWRVFEHDLQAQTISALCLNVLARFEAAYSTRSVVAGIPTLSVGTRKKGGDLVEKVLSLLWAARRGLRESELLAVLGISQAIWSPLYLLLQTVLVNRAGLLNFFHDSLRQAVQARYLSSDDKKRAVHRQLADYFEQQPLSSRRADELPYQLQQAVEPVRLLMCISQIPMLMRDEKEYELWHYWQWLGTSHGMVDAYQVALTEFEKTVSEGEELWGVLDSIATFFQITGYYSPAIALFRQVLKSREKVLGIKHPDVVQSLNRLAFLLEKKGDYERAEPLYHLALKICEQVLGAAHPHPNRAISVERLALVLQRLGYYEEAAPLYRQALKIREYVLGTAHPLTVQSVSHLALLLQDQGEYEEAERLYRQALEIRENVLGVEHPDTVTSLSHLAFLFQSKGDYKAAGALYRQAFKIRRKFFGPKHPLTASSLNSLALLFANKGDYERAEPLYREVLKIREKVLGVEHTNTATSLNNLALLLQYKGNYKVAEQLYRKNLRICERCESVDHPSTATALNNLALLLKKKGDYEGGERLYRKALKISEKFKGAEHPSTATALNNLALLLKAKGDYEGAESLYRRALVIFEKVLGAKHVHTVSVRKNLVLLLKLKRKDEYNGLTD